MNIADSVLKRAKALRKALSEMREKRVGVCVSFEVWDHNLDDPKYETSQWTIWDGATHFYGEKENGSIKELDRLIASILEVESEGKKWINSQE